MDFKPRAQHFWYWRIWIQPFFAKISQKQPDALISMLRDCFFGIAAWFYIKLVSHLPFHWSNLATIRRFVNLPKFAQIPNWWRHTGSCVHFQLTRPIFSDSANIFSLEYIKQCYLVPKLYGLRITLCITVYRVKCISFAKTPQVTSSTVRKNMEFNICVFLGLLKSPTLKCSRIVKN